METDANPTDAQPDSPAEVTSAEPAATADAPSRLASVAIVLQQREAVAQALLREPNFTDEYFIAVVIARCMRLRERSAAIPPSMREYAFRMSQILEGFAPLLTLLETIPATDESAELREKVEREQQRIAKAIDALTGTETMGRCWAVLFNVSTWSRVEIDEVARAVLAGRNPEAGSLDLGAFLRELALLSSIEASGCDPTALASLYRAWRPISPQSRAAARGNRRPGRAGAGRRWVAAEEFFNAVRWDSRDAASIKAQYQRFLRERSEDPEELMDEAAFRGGLWMSAANALRRMGTTTTPDDWEQEWLRRQSASKA